jgi:hypothetical protein
MKDFLEWNYLFILCGKAPFKAIANLQFAQSKGSYSELQREETITLFPGQGGMKSA